MDCHQFCQHSVEQSYQTNEGNKQDEDTVDMCGGQEG